MRQDAVAACSTFHLTKELSMTSLRHRLIEHAVAESLAAHSNIVRATDIAVFTLLQQNRILAIKFAS
jgi:hypothetical protein